MNFLNENSLAATLDALNEALFFGKPIPKADRQKAARWIVSRQGEEGSYTHKLFAPTSEDFKGSKTFTGEKMTSRAQISHILGEEACRTLMLLECDDAAKTHALAEANASMLKRIESSDRKWEGYFGMFCCGQCTPAY